MTTRTTFVEHIQVKLPCAKLLLQKKPGPLFDWNACTLTAVSLEKPFKIFSMTFENGLGEDPLDDAENSFVDLALRALNR